jgi:hypothetical protein
MIVRDMSRKKPNNIDKGAKPKKRGVARTSDRTIKKLLKKEKAPAAESENGHV